MGIFNFFKRKELRQISLLTKMLNEERKKNIENQKKDILEDFEKFKLLQEENKNKIIREINELTDKKNSLEPLLVELEDKLLLQEYGIYTPIYDCYSLDEYKDKLETIRIRQKNLIRLNLAATCSVRWTINNSVSKGEVKTKQNIKQILRCFNCECDILIEKVKFNNVESYIDKINKSAGLLNKINKSNAIKIEEDYINLKIEELKIVHEYKLKKQEEKEKLIKYREQLREEAKLQKEIEESKKSLEKEKTHYSNALIDIEKQISDCNNTDIVFLEEKRDAIKCRLSKISDAIQHLDYREANNKAGYVYIISNIGSFGENVYKIGMTRRLDPTERIDELGDASVPFKFDVHAIIFSDDAPKLEASLHNAFENKKVNMVNTRREFFNVTLEEIENVVKANYDKTVDFIRIPQAEQYRESIRMKNTI